MGETLPTTVFDALLRSRGVRQVTPVAGGLSGALIFRAIADPPDLGAAGGEWVVRGWPEGVSSQRVAEVHRVVQRARREGCRTIPGIEPLEPAGAGGEMSTQMVAEGRVWECCQWMPGRPPQSADDLPGILREAAVGVACFHRAVAGLGETLGPVPAVHARLQRLAQIDRIVSGTRLRPRLLFGSPSLDPAVERAVECLDEVWSGQRQRAERLLQPWAACPLPQQYVLRDIHLENALFVEGRLSGIVDCDAIRIDSPATDLARLVGSSALLPRPPERQHAVPLPTLWSEALAGYRSVRPFSEQEELLARVLADASPLVMLANWVVWLAYEGRSFPGSAAAVEKRVEGWTRVVREQFGMDPSASNFETR